MREALGPLAADQAAMRADLATVNAAQATTDAKLGHVIAAQAATDAKVDRVLDRVNDVMVELVRMQTAAENKDLARVRRKLDDVHARLGVLERQQRG